VAQADAARLRVDVLDGAAGDDLAAGRADLGGERAGDRLEVHDRGPRRVQRLDAAHVRFDVRDLGGGDALEAGDAVGGAAALELVELRPLGLRDRDDQLAVAARGQAALDAVVVQLARALGAEAGLERAGRVVDAGVQDAGVVPGLVEALDGLALEHRDGAVGAACQQLARDREADDAGADHDDVGLRARRG
jgi:hypothetical protein